MEGPIKPRFCLSSSRSKQCLLGIRERQRSGKIWGQRRVWFVGVHDWAVNLAQICYHPRHSQSVSSVSQSVSQSVNQSVLLVGWHIKQFWQLPYSSEGGLSERYPNSRKHLSFHVISLFLSISLYFYLCLCLCLFLFCFLFICFVPVCWHASKSDLHNIRISRIHVIAQILFIIGGSWLRTHVILIHTPACGRAWYSEWL